MEDAQVESVLTAKAFHYVMAHYGLRRIEKRPYREFFRVAVPRMETYLAARGKSIEDYGQYHNLSILERDHQWILRFYEYDDRSGPNTSEASFPTREAARAAMMEWVLNDQYRRLDYHFN